MLPSFVLTAFEFFVRRTFLSQNRWIGIKVFLFKKALNKKIIAVVTGDVTTGYNVSPDLNVCSALAIVDNLPSDY